MKWKFTLPNSKELRQAIEDEDGEQVLKELISAYEWIAIHMDDYAIDALIEDVQWDLDCQAFDEESVDSHLEDFYNYCDNRGVWVELC